MGRHHRLINGILCGIGLGLSISAGAAEPLRVVSMNLCIDKLLLRILPLDHIVGLSPLAANPEYTGYVGGIPPHKIHHNHAEELLALKPDVLLAGEFGSTQTVIALGRLGVEVNRIPLPRTLEQSQAFIKQIGQMVHAEQASQEYWQQQFNLVEVVRNLVQQHEPGHRILLYLPNGKAIGAGTLEHEILTYIGYRNVAAEAGYEGFVSLPLEELLLLNPDRILLSGTSEHFSLANEILQHPLLRNRLSAHTLPQGSSVCPAILSGELAEAMAADLLQEKP